MSNTERTERLYSIIKRPLVTEKSHLFTAENKYSFEVLRDATKIEIKAAIEMIFPGRKVIKVCVVKMPSHQKRVGSKFGRTQISKKAIVTIQGEPIAELTGA